MAPTSNDPKNLHTILNIARRRALMGLVKSIILHMRTTVPDLSRSSQSQNNNALLFVNKSDLKTHDGNVTSDEEDESRKQRNLTERVDHEISTPEMRQLSAAALRYFDSWEKPVLSTLYKILSAPEDPRAPRKKVFVDPEAEDEDEQSTKAEYVDALQTLYTPIATRLTTIPQKDLKCVVSSMLLMLLSLGNYSAHSRVLLLYLTSSLGLPLSILVTEEREVAQTLLLASKELSADAETQKHKEENQNARRWKVGLASIAGAAVIGITGGLAAPVVAGAIGGLMGGVGLGGLASFLGIFAMNGALMGTLFGAYGMKMTGDRMDAYAKEVEDFKFIPVKDEWGMGIREDDEVENRRLRVTIGINGWLDGKEGMVKPWQSLGEDSEVFALRYEMNALIELGASLKKMVSSYAWSYVKLEILKRTVLASLWSALWPVYMIKMATFIDNPFAIARNRSEKAGQVLADALINRAQGERPVTLIGYSLGARVIYSCLNTLAERKEFGLVESVVLIGAPVPSNASNWLVMRSVVSGRIINVFTENDYILGFLYRATSIQFGVAGLSAINGVNGVDNLDLSAEVNGHLRYPDLIGKILKKAGFEDLKIQNTEIEKEGPIVLIDEGPGESWESAIAMPKFQKESSDIPIRSIAMKRQDSEDEDVGIQLVDNDETDSAKQNANSQDPDRETMTFE